MKVAWLSWAVGVALLAAVIAVALHVAEAEEFARLLEQVEPAWLAAALALQAATYLAQGEIWRAVARAAGAYLPLGPAYRLSLVKLLVDQALPSSGLSGAIVVAGALRRRGIAEDVATAGIVVSASAYLLAYAAALGAGLAVMVMQGRASTPIVAAGALFMVGATAVAVATIALSGRQARSPKRLRHLLEALGRARPSLSRDPRLLVQAAALQLIIVGLDCLTLWALIRSLGTVAPLAAVFTSFMISTLLRTISIVPGGLGTFEAVSVATLYGAGIELPVALSATLLFRGLSFWLPMLPGFFLSRGLLRRSGERPAQPAAPSAYWSTEAAAVLKAQGSATAGLSSDEAAARLRRHGPNSIEDRPRLTVLRLLLRQFESPLVLILVFGAAVSLFLQDWVEAAIILAIVLGSALLGFAQEYRATAAVASAAPASGADGKGAARRQRSGRSRRRASCPATWSCSPPAISSPPTAWCSRRRTSW